MPTFRRNVGMHIPINYMNMQQQSGARCSVRTPCGLRLTDVRRIIPIIPAAPRYGTHDADREQPVHFRWQLIDHWPPESAVLTRMGRQFVEGQPSAVAPPLDAITASGLVEAPPPRGRPRTGSHTAEFRARKVPIFQCRTG